MRRSKLNFIVDAVAFVAFVFLVTTGILIKYLLPPGSGHFAVLWGMDRHQWGQIHFWISFLLLVTLGFHLILHWRWIVCIVKGRPREGSGHRVALAIVGILALIGLAGAPLVSPVEETGEPPRRERSAEEAEEEGFHIEGSMTLGEVESATGVPAAVILQELGLPSRTSPDEQLGQLRREYGFEIQAVRDIVEKHRETR